MNTPLIRKALGSALGLMLALVSLSGCKKDAPPSEDKKPEAPAKTARITIGKDKLARFATLPAVFESEQNPITDPKIALGRMLYYDARLSKNHDISCNTCHDLARFGVDSKPTSPGHKGEPGPRNSPTGYTSAGQAIQCWDGRSPDVVQGRGKSGHRRAGSPAERPDTADDMPREGKCHRKRTAPRHGAE